MPGHASKGLSLVYWKYTREKKESSSWLEAPHFYAKRLSDFVAENPIPVAVTAISVVGLTTGVIFCRNKNNFLKSLNEWAQSAPPEKLVNYHIAKS